ncbi:MAG: ABC transporter substrate-binding protein [Phyllobacterium sp.]
MVQWTRRHFLQGTGAGIALLAAGRTAFSADNSFRFITPFTLSLAFSPVLYASAAGYYADEGLSVDIEAGKGASLVSQMVIAKRMESGRTGGTNYIVSRINDGAPLISIATIAQLSPFFVLSSAKDPVSSMADLKGRTVGMATLGGSMEGTIDLMLKKSGISPDTVNKVKVADSAASFALVEAGRAGAFVGNISSMITATNAMKDVSSMPIDDGIPGQVYVARPDEIDANPERFVKFLRATHRAVLEIVEAEDLDPILTKLAGKYEINGISDREIARQDLKANAQNWAAKGKENLLRNMPEVWDSAVKLLAGADLVKEAVDAGTLYRNDLLDQALTK